ncbi:hypothetical protein RB597_003402 [Gaeumannomyces tritici]
MDNLICRAFDYLDSHDPSKVRKGLRQIELLMAKICLKNGEPSEPPYHTLEELGSDVCFMEYARLQGRFEYNIASRLIALLEKLLGSGNEENDLTIIATLDLLHGSLLLHRESRALFRRKPTMELLLDLLEPCNCPAIQQAALLTLVAALLDAPDNLRTLESVDGLLAITSLFKARSTSRQLKLKLMEFLYFYLMPETASIPRAEQRDSVPGILQRSPSKLAKAFGGAEADVAGGRRSRSDSTSAAVLSTEEKQALLSRYLSNVDDLVRDLRGCTPFGVVC